MIHRSLKGSVHNIHMPKCASKAFLDAIIVPLVHTGCLKKDLNVGDGGQNPLPVLHSF